MQRLIPIAVLLAVLIALAAYFGPPVYRGWLFKRDCNAMLASAQVGKISPVIAAIDPGQRQQYGDLLLQYLPADYYKNIQSFKLLRYEESQPGKIWANVIMRVEQGDGTGLYEGRLPWRFDGKHWYWDFGNSMGAAYSPTGESQNWIKLEELIALAGRL
jgi:hypothetical protein